MTQELLYDPLEPATLEDPYPLYAEMRDKAPVLWHPQMKSWILTRYRDCRNVLRDHDLFARDRRRVGEEIPEFRQSLQSLDPPEQGPLRSLLMNSLHSRDLDGIGVGARQQIAAIFERLAEREVFDFMSEIAAPIALTITADLIGVQEPDLQAYVAISEGIAQRMDAGLRPEAAALGDAARRELNQLVDRWFADVERPGLLNDVRRSAPRVDVPDYYIRNTTGVMFNASYGTVFATAGNVMSTFLHRPGALEQLRDERLLTTGVDELIRFDGPAQGTTRVATRRTMIGDTVIEPRQLVLTLMAAANRDPEQFATPDELVLDRSPNQHLGFGWGPHSCVGALFGRIAIRELIVGLHAAPTTLRLAGEPTRRRTATVRCIDVLPVTFRN
ncbi:cytochrome P450 [Paractinoplanes rishiriensis]|uniref:Cytochrome P450 n=1 Tax=Paractinoplanes rishiriensis TaxID=1050105 RepID=A0A919KCS8_9ACTN|nr:cytochrome P450 [Actinoplanes rishiriensis]GIF01352.1 hypothetical protein Ari01nite_88160 [Actinoplanes rishiriensis]